MGAEVLQSGQRHAGDEQEFAEQVVARLVEYEAQELWIAGRHDVWLRRQAGVAEVRPAQHEIDAADNHQGGVDAHDSHARRNSPPSQGGAGGGLRQPAE